MAVRATWTRGLALAASGLLRMSGLPSAPAPDYDAAAFDVQVRQIFADDHVTILDPLGHPAAFLIHLASCHDVLFHGSKRGGLTELLDRESNDTRAFGSQKAVYASQDPLWAMFFAVSNRAAATSIRNGSLASVAAIERRYYYFSVGIADPEVPLTTPGWVYVLPAEGFSREPPAGGVIDTGQWVLHRPVRPLAAVAVGPHDFPIRDMIQRHARDEPMRRTLLRSRRARSVRRQP